MTSSYCFSFLLRVKLDFIVFSAAGYSLFATPCTESEKGSQYLSVVHPWQVVEMDVLNAPVR